MNSPSPSASSISPVLRGLSAAAAWTSAGTVLALAGLLYRYGFDGLAFVAGPMAGLALGGMLLAPAMARAGVHSIPEFIRQRFGTVAAALAIVTVILTAFILAVAGISAAGLLLSDAADVPFAAAALAAAIAAVALARIDSDAVSTRMGAILAAIVLAGIVIPAVALSLALQGALFPPIAYGEAITRIGDLERQMIVDGLATANSLKPHARPFLQIDSVSVAALIVSLMAGTAVLPQILHQPLAAATPSAARATAAWTAVFVLIAVLMAPAVAALTKVHLYETLASKVPLTALPDWIVTLVDRGHARIHGVSISLVDAVSRAATTGTTDPKAIGAVLAGESAGHVAREWAALTPAAQKVVLAGAGSPGASLSHQDIVDIFRSTLLPAVAAVSGNKSALLTPANLDIDPEALILALPQSLGLPVALTYLMIAAAVVAATAIASAALGVIANTYRGTAAHPARSRTVALLLAAIAALALVVVRNGDSDGLVPAALSFAAAGLFPALVFGLWWRRANAIGAVLAMGLGLAIALAYTLGTHYAAVPFHTTWSNWSGAAPMAKQKFAALEKAWIGATSDAERTAAWTALDAHAAGTPLVPGVANWFGLPGIASAVLALPVGCLVLLLAGIVPSRRTPAAQDLIDRLRRPAAPATPPRA